MKIILKTYLVSFILICFFLLTLPMLKVLSHGENVEKTQPQIDEVIKERERECQEAIIEAKKYFVSHYEDVEKNLSNLFLIARWYQKDWITPKETIPIREIEDRSDCVDYLFLALSKHSYKYQSEHESTGKDEVMQLLDKIIEQDICSWMRPYGMVLKMLAYTELPGVSSLEEDAKKTIEICDILIENHPESYFSALAQLMKGGAFIYRKEYDNAIIELKKVKNYNRAYRYWGESLHSFSDMLIEDALKQKKEELLETKKDQRPVIEQFR